MPELPEVETTARYLRERLIGLKVSKAVHFWKRTVGGASSQEFASSLQGLKLQTIGRRGKYLVFEFGDRNRSQFLLGHLRMSGSMDVISSSQEISKHDRVIISFSNKQDLRFNDPRKFGRLFLVKDPNAILSKLGPEPNSPDFCVESFTLQLANKRGAIKPLLLKQNFIAGIGNIYADESLWQAKIHPLRPACSVSQKEARLLTNAMKSILNKAIEQAGTDFGDGVVDGGGYSPVAYGRDGQACKRCGTIIQKILVGQRGTHFCPGCQIHKVNLR